MLVGSLHLVESPCSYLTAHLRLSVGSSYVIPGLWIHLDGSASCAVPVFVYLWTAFFCFISWTLALLPAPRRLPWIGCFLFVDLFFLLLFFGRLEAALGGEGVL